MKLREYFNNPFNACATFIRRCIAGECVNTCSYIPTHFITTATCIFGNSAAAAHFKMATKCVD